MYKQTYPKTVVYMSHVCMGEVEHEVTVRCINGHYHCRVFVNGLLNQEVICESKMQIGLTCRQMLRMEDKCGNISAFASAARTRLNNPK